MEVVSTAAAGVEWAWRHPSRLRGRRAGGRGDEVFTPLQGKEKEEVCRCTHVLQRPRR